MGDPVISLSRTDVTTPTSQYLSVRFIYVKGRAAVWQENKRAGTADRVLFTESATLVKPNSARYPMQIITPSETWEVSQRSTGCGCSSKLKRLPLGQLLDPEFTHFG